MSAIDGQFSLRSSARWKKRKSKTISLLSITTDPERDTAPVSQRLRRPLQGGASVHWSFLTGTPPESAKVWQDFGVHVVKNESGQVQHTVRLRLWWIARGNRRIDYYGDKWQDKEVLKDIQWLRLDKKVKKRRAPSLFLAFLLVRLLLLFCQRTLPKTTQGVLEIQLKDHREAIDDFAKLDITVDKILCQPKSQGSCFGKPVGKKLNAVNRDYRF